MVHRAQGVLIRRVERVDLGLQPGVRLGVCEQAEEDVAHRGRGRVRAGDELRQGFGGELLAAEFLAGVVAAFHEAGEQVDAVCVWFAEALIYAGDGDAGEVLDDLEGEAHGDVLEEQVSTEDLCFYVRDGFGLTQPM